VTDEQKRASVIRNRWCQLCGEPLGKWMFFTGGTEAAKANQYFEPGCHMDCLIYAMQVCPFIVGRIEHAELDKVASSHPDMTVRADDTFSTKRNPLWIIKKATSFSLMKSNDGTILLYPHAVKETPALKPEEMTATDWRQVEKFLL